MTLVIIGVIVAIVFGAIVGVFVGRFRALIDMPNSFTPSEVNPNAKAELEENLKRIRELKAQRKP